MTKPIGEIVQSGKPQVACSRADTVACGLPLNEHDSTQDFLHHSWRFDARQSLFESAPLKEQLLMMQSQQMQNGGVEIVHADRVFDDLVTEFICLAVGGSALRPTSRDP